MSQFVPPKNPKMVTPKAESKYINQTKSQIVTKKLGVKTPAMWISLKSQLVSMKTYIMTAVIDEYSNVPGDRTCINKATEGDFTFRKDEAPTKPHAWVYDDYGGFPDFPVGTKVRFSYMLMKTRFGPRMCWIDVLAVVE